jgi:peroxiredoxin
MINVGDSAPAVELTNIDGSSHSLSSTVRQHPVLLAFFALDCLTCEMSFLFWDRIQEMYGGADFELWSVSLDSTDEAREFYERSGVEFPILLDEGRSVAQQYGATATPALYLVGSDAVVLASHEGFDRPAVNAMIETIAAHTGRETIEIAAAEAPDLRPGCVIHFG